MVLTEEQTRQVKESLRKQVEHLPPEKRKEAEEQIDSMSVEAIESGLKMSGGGREEIFRMIANKEIDAVIVEENSEAIAVLELNPLTRGHILVIPKEKVNVGGNISDSIIEFAKSLAKKVQRNLKANKVKVSMENKFGEAIIELIPEYEKPLEQIKQRKKADVKELEQVKKEINTVVIEKPKLEVIKREERVQREFLKLKRRIP
ncbi:HIT domain-containing protein [Candidatus Pacearchaeota archaeon]|nr:HIT domain-containing protein [Candidatus Pacearchaeota archaeon]